MAFTVLYGTAYAWGLGRTDQDIAVPNFFQGDTTTGPPFHFIYKRHPLPPNSNFLFDGISVGTPVNRKGPWPGAHEAPVTGNPGDVFLGNEISEIILPADGVFEAAGFCNGLIGYLQPPPNVVSSWSGSFQYYLLRNGSPLMSVFGEMTPGIAIGAEWEFPSFIQISSTAIEDHGNEVGYSLFSQHPSVRFQGQAGDSISFQLVNNVEVIDHSVPGRTTGLRHFNTIFQVLWLIPDDEPPPPPPPPPPGEEEFFSRRNQTNLMA